jgi:hypothetical protein
VVEDMKQHPLTIGSFADSPACEFVLSLPAHDRYSKNGTRK